jgi:hypothetical protein
LNASVQHLAAEAVIFTTRITFAKDIMAGQISGGIDRIVLIGNDGDENHGMVCSFSSVPSYEETEQEKDNPQGSQ